MPRNGAGRRTCCGKEASLYRSRCFKSSTGRSPEPPARTRSVLRWRYASSSPFASFRCRTSLSPCSAPASRAVSAYGCRTGTGRFSPPRAPAAATPCTPRICGTRENSDDANARIEHDKVLARIVTGMVKDDAELFKQFMDNDDFKRWMTATVFELACEQAGAP